MTQTTETEIRALRDLIIGLREETRVGFTEVRGEIQKSEAKTDTKLAEIRGDIDTKFAEVRGDIKVIEERTKLGFWGFVWRAIVIAVLVSLISVANKFVFGGGLGSLSS
jgi:porphobilinogen deaminase